MRHPFLRLLGKDIRQALPAWLLITAGIAAWTVYLHTRVGVWPPRLVTGMSLTPLFLLPYRALWVGLTGWWHERRGNHLPFLLTLPVPGWWHTSAKLLAALLELAAAAAVTLAGTWTLSRALGVPLLGGPDLPPDARPALVRAALASLPWLVLPGLGLLVTCLILGQVAGLAGLLAPRLQGLVGGIAFVVAGWALFRGGWLLSRLLGWLPPLPVTGWQWDGTAVHQHVVYLESGPLVGYLVMLAVLFWLGSRLLERDLEV